jgi:hypothetical protein
MSAPLKCERSESTERNAKKFFDSICDSEPTSQINTELSSPILPGYRIMRRNVYYETGKTIYQIFGHQPVGYSTTVDLFTQDENTKSYLINLDSTNSFTGTKFNDKQNISTSILIIPPNNNPYISSHINFNKTPIVKTLANANIANKTIKFGDLKMTRISPFNDYKTILSYSENSESYGDFKFEFTKYQNLLTKIYKINDSTNTDKYKEFEINFHGIHESKYFFTVTNTGYDSNGTFNLFESFNKSFFILSEKDFEEFTGITTLTGNSYREKYLKYKNKYLLLKNNL